MNSRILSLGVWLSLLLLSGWVVARAHYIADLSAFLPRSPSPEQRLLIQQLQDGLASRLVLIGIEGGDALSRSRASHAMAAALRQRPEFVSVSNGEAAAGQQDQQLLFQHRYLLSDAVTDERFSVAGLQSAIADNIEFMSSPAGLLAKQLFRSDPTGELLHVVDRIDAGMQPNFNEGVWSSIDGQRALLLAQTRSRGSDTDEQAQALSIIGAAWTHNSSPALHLLTSSPGKFAVQARATIKREAVRLSLLSTALIVILLLLVYRSVPALLLGLLPVASGALAGVAAVALGFGLVHGITLGFGVTLIGESVDYSIYLLVQSRAAGAPGTASSTLWSTIVLGVATSICGFASLLPSAFPGLAQLGLFSISGLIAAAAVTRFILPQLIPASLKMADLRPLGLRTARVLSRLRLPTTACAAVALVCALALFHLRERLWNRDIAALSPAPAAAQRLDAQLRSDLGAPELGNLIVIRAADEQTALSLSEAVGERLDSIIDAGTAGYDSPAHYLPSDATQSRRRASLPAEAQLRQRVNIVSATLGLQPDALEPFIKQTVAVSAAPLLTRASMNGTSFALALDALLWQADANWYAVLPLRGAVDLDRVRAALEGLAPSRILVLNIKQQTDALYANYLNEAIRLSLIGFAAIVLLLILVLRDATRVIRVIAPLLLSVLVVAAALALAQIQLTILHLIGMLLIIAVGSNYALFFDRRAAEPGRGSLPLTLASLIIANACTVIGFGVLAFSSVPVLNALGMTVAPGTLLALWFSALIAPRALWA